MSYIQYKKQETPSVPETGAIRQWVGSDGVLRYIDAEGNITTVTKGDKGDIGDTGATGPAGVDGVDGDTGPQGPQGEVGPSGPMTVESFVSEKSVVTLPDSTTLQTIYTHDITISGDGPCFLDISLAIKGHSTSNDYEFVAEFGGVALTPTLVEEVKDLSTVQSNWRSQCLDLGEVVAGTYTLELQFRKDNTGGTALLKNYTAKVVRY